MAAEGPHHQLQPRQMPRHHRPQQSACARLFDEARAGIAAQLATMNGTWPQCLFYLEPRCSQLAPWHLALSIF